MKPLIKRSLIKIAFALVIWFLLAILASALMPVLTNDMALGQLENDDVSFMMWESWQYIDTGIRIAQMLVCVICGASISEDIYRTRIRKEIEGEN